MCHMGSVKQTSHARVSFQGLPPLVFSPMGLHPAAARLCSRIVVPHRGLCAPGFRSLCRVVFGVGGRAGSLSCVVVRPPPPFFSIFLPMCPLFHLCVVCGHLVTFGVCFRETLEWEE